MLAQLQKVGALHGPKILRRPLIIPLGPPENLTSHTGYNVEPLQSLMDCVLVLTCLDQSMSIGVFRQAYGRLANASRDLKTKAESIGQSAH